jgi:molybdopterin-guanine dinucleotide biosynthesis protein A
MQIEAALLTGGASLRMGTDKGSIPVDGIPQGVRIANALRTLGIPVTILGRKPIDGHMFLPDDEEFAGPLSALSKFSPRADAVFVCSCDLPLFDARIIDVLVKALANNAASVPRINGYRQPLCALYRASAFDRIPDLLAQDGACAMRWIDGLTHVVVSEEMLFAAGLSPECAQGANTREELDAMLLTKAKSFWSCSE